MKNIILLTILIGCSPREAVEEIHLISEFQLLEHHRLRKSEYIYDQKDSLIFEKTTFKSYDEKNRLINENDIVFYKYNKLGNIVEDKSIHKRDRIIKVNTTQYIYDENQNLKHKVKQSDPLDTIQTNLFNSNDQITKSIKNFETITYEYNVDKLIKKTTVENGEESRISNFNYDSLGRLSTDYWVFSKKNRMKTTFTYDDENRLITEVDSSFNSSKPKEFVEFKTEYKYNKLDSINEITKSGRVVS